jgi:hypothetical protein
MISRSMQTIQAEVNNCKSYRLEIAVVLVRKRDLVCLLQLLRVLLHHSFVDSHLWRSQCRRFDKEKIRIADKLLCKPLSKRRNPIFCQRITRAVNQDACIYLEWLFELVVRTRRDLIILQVLLPVEINLFGLDLAILDIDLNNILFSSKNRAGRFV